ncbi:MAG: hypothetical protein L0332_08405 [Chloroflexi bacterium]|nr:hypothetical protein [Chloroflexota bacterium]MCI0575406.1 hypothetical protein [Chloroflexota bacterium]MCI0645462.1 hypothetical protein [Chloroflexota bacterium]MCI0726729.1 hypothetical protein [Chloroflexota bacterium]
MVNERLFFHLDSLSIQLYGAGSWIKQQARILLRDWPEGGHTPEAGEPGSAPRKNCLTVHFHSAESLPPPPAEGLFFTQPSQELPGDLGDLTAYRGQQETILYFGRSAALRFFKEDDGQNLSYCLTATVTPRLLSYGRFSDVLFTGLAPLLRQQGYYLSHTFAVTHHGRALLLVGPSGCGKTTSGLCLVTSGWGFLANDITLLKERPDGIYALPVPGAFSVSPGTLELLPGLASLPDEQLYNSLTHKSFIPVGEVADSWAEAAPVAAVCFLNVSDRPESVLEPLSRAVTLARLLESSVDRWDEAALPGHVAFLQALSSQAKSYQLHLGRDLEQLPRLLEGVVKRLESGD